MKTISRSSGESSVPANGHANNDPGDLVDPSTTAGTMLESARELMHEQPGDALKLAMRAANIAEVSGDFRLAATAHRVVGQVYRRLGEHEAAVASFTSAAELALRSGDELLASQVQIGNIDSLMMLGKLDSALSLGNHLVQELESLGATVDAGKALFNVGNLYFRRDQYDNALCCYNRAALSLEVTGDPFMLAQMKVNCGNVQTHLNLCEDALESYEGARQAFAKCGRKLDAAFVDANEGYLLHASGRHAQALAHLARANSVLKELGHQHESARCDIDAAFAYHSLNLIPEAIECADRALAIFDSLPLDYDRAKAELVRASCLTNLGSFDSAYDGLRKAEAIFTKQRNSLQRAHVRLVRSNLALAGNDLRLAMREAQTAARTFSRSRMGGWAAEARMLTARVEHATNETNVRRLKSIVRSARLHRRGWLESQAEQKLGIHFARHADFRSALRHLRAAVNALELARTLISTEALHANFMLRKESIYEDLVGALLAHGGQRHVEEALQIVERSKSRTLFERVQAALAAPTHLRRDSVALAKLGKLRSALSREYHRESSIGEYDSQRKSLLRNHGNSRDELEKEYASALRDAEIESVSTRRSYLSIPPSVKLIQAALAPDEALVEFYKIGDHFFAFIVDNAKVLAVPVALVSDVSSMARRLRYHLHKCTLDRRFVTELNGEVRAGIDSVLTGLFRLVLKPILRELAVKKLVIVPHGDLHGLPFHAFRDGSCYAADLWEIVYAPSAATWLAKTTPSDFDSRKNDDLLMGVNAPGLTDVACEIAQIQSLMPQSRVFTGADATLHAFHQHAPSCRVIHLASHAHFRTDNPLFSGLQFADGWLLARDLYEVRLCCDLATLSACNTGVMEVGPGDELYGLVRGFLSAGAQSVAASLWPADDSATAELMSAFYSRLSAGDTKAAALRSAQQTVRETRPHPYHWAAFGLVGGR